MKKQEHLPMLGVGPIYVCGITLPTIAAVLARKLAIFSSGEVGKDTYAAHGFGHILDDARCFYVGTGRCCSKS